jgi:hypothetical protein
VSVDGTSLWFDVDEPALVPDRPAMRGQADPYVSYARNRSLLWPELENYGMEN